MVPNTVQQFHKRQKGQGNRIERGTKVNSHLLYLTYLRQVSQVQSDGIVLKMLTINR